jgi:hypothetical protein
MMACRVILVAALLPELAACIYDGSYRIRGTLRLQADGTERIPENATVTVKGCGRAAGPGNVVLHRDGTFAGKYAFGGMGFLFLVPGDGSPRIDFGAPGYRTVQMRLRSAEPVPGVTRRACAPPENEDPFCFWLDVVLSPDRTPNS